MHWMDLLFLVECVQHVNDVPGCVRILKPESNRFVVGQYAQIGCNLWHVDFETYHIIVCVIN